MEVLNAIHRLNELIKVKNSRICAGLDPVLEDIPDSLKKRVAQEMDLTEMLSRERRMLSVEKRKRFLENVVYEYCVEYIQAVKDVVPAIKINSAFFEKEGLFFIGKSTKTLKNRRVSCKIDNGLIFNEKYRGGKIQCLKKRKNCLWRCGSLLVWCWAALPVLR